MKTLDFLPLGTILVVTGATKKLMIIQRSMKVKTQDGEKYFDYGGVIYPEGLIDQKIVYFNHPDINKIISKGYSDDEDQLIIDQINELLVTLDDQGNKDPFAELRED